MVVGVGLQKSRWSLGTQICGTVLDFTGGSKRPEFVSHQFDDVLIDSQDGGGSGRCNGTGAFATAAAVGTTIDVRSTVRLGSGCVLSCQQLLPCLRQRIFGPFRSLDRRKINDLSSFQDTSRLQLVLYGR